MSHSQTKLIDRSKKAKILLAVECPADVKAKADASRKIPSALKSTVRCLIILRRSNAGAHMQESTIYIFVPPSLTSFKRTLVDEARRLLDKAPSLVVTGSHNDFQSSTAPNAPGRPLTAPAASNTDTLMSVLPVILYAASRRCDLDLWTDVRPNNEADWRRPVDTLLDVILRHARDVDLR